MGISTNYIRLRKRIPDHVAIVLAAKTRSVDEVSQVIDAGATDIGENYVQEGAQMRARLGTKTDSVKWHMIGHLQTNKINKAIDAFDFVQTVDSFKKADAINKRVKRTGLDPLPVFIQINIGSEDAKAGIKPSEHEPFELHMEQLVLEMAKLTHIRVQGLMTMGPRFGDPEKNRPYFRRTRELFEKLSAISQPNVRMTYLSMGMSNSYKVAIEEGSNMVRIGSAVFGACRLD